MDFPVGIESRLVLRNNGTVYLNDDKLTADATLDLEGITVEYSLKERTVRVRAAAESGIPSTDFFYANDFWWGQPPSEACSFENALVPTPWIVDFAKQFGLVAHMEGFFHPANSVLKVGPITMSNSDTVLIGPKTCSSTGVFDEIEYANVICRANDEMSEGYATMLEILDKQTGENHFYRHDLEGYWFQFGITEFDIPLTWWTTLVGNTILFFCWFFRCYCFSTGQVDFRSE